jgi:hypothetical protein
MVFVFEINSPNIVVPNDLLIDKLTTFARDGRPICPATYTLQRAWRASRKRNPPQALKATDYRVATGDAPGSSFRTHALSLLVILTVQMGTPKRICSFRTSSQGIHTERSGNASSGAHARTSMHHILVVDDEPGVRESLEMLLMSEDTTSLLQRTALRPFCKLKECRLT